MITSHSQHQPRARSMKVPHEVVDRIFEFIEPNVEVYCRLSKVSQSFHTYFTSDKAWGRLCLPNRVTGGRHFQYLSPQKKIDKALMKTFWTGKGDFKCDHAALYKHYNLFIVIGAVVYHQNFEHIEPNDTMVIKSALAIGQFDKDDFHWPYDRELSLVAVSYDGNRLKFCCKFQNDHDFVKNAVQVRSQWSKIEGPAIRYASEDLQNNDEIGEAALRTDASSIHFVNERIRYKFLRDRDWVLWAVTDYPYILKHVGWFQNDREIVFQAFQRKVKPDKFDKKSLGLLFYVSKELRRDKEIYELAIQAQPENLEHCEQLVIHRETYCRLVDLAFSQGIPLKIKIGDVNFLDYLSEEDQVNVDLNIKIASSHCSNFRQQGLRMQNNPMVAWAACRSFPENLAHIPKHVEGYKNLVLSLVEHCSVFKLPIPIDKIPKIMLTEMGIVNTVMACGVSIHSIDAAAGLNYANDRLMFRRFLFFPQTRVHNIPEKFRTDHQIVIEAVQKNGCLLRYANAFHNDVSKGKKLIRAAFQHSHKCCYPYHEARKFLAYTDLTRDNELFKICGVQSSRPGTEADKLDRHAALSTLEKHPDLYPILSGRYGGDSKFNDDAVTANPLVVQYMDNWTYCDSVTTGKAEPSIPTVRFVPLCQGDCAINYRKDAEKQSSVLQQVEDATQNQKRIRGSK